MGRIEKIRSIDSPPRCFQFRASDTPVGTGENIQLKLDEYEALRLSDKLGYSHGEASIIMNVSRPTFTRLLNRARKKMADFLTEGGSLEVRGGKVLFASDVYCCKNCHRPFLKEKDKELICPRCQGNNVIKAQPDCEHDCRCCEEADHSVVD